MTAGRWMALMCMLVGILGACSTTTPSAINEPLSNSGDQPTPGPTVTSTALSLDPTCLVGDWTVVGMEEAVAESLTSVQSPLKLEGITGKIRYSFRSDGSLEIGFDQLALTFSGMMDGQAIRARNAMSGIAQASYRLDIPAHEILFSNFGGDGIQVSTEINGQVLAQGNFPAWRAFSSNLASSNVSVPTTGPARVIEESLAAISCMGDEMHLQTIQPNPGQPVALARNK